MSELQKTKARIAHQLHGLCAHCSTGSTKQHACPVRELISRVNTLSGVPLMVDNQFRGLVFAHA